MTYLWLLVGTLATTFLALARLGMDSALQFSGVTALTTVKPVSMPCMLCSEALLTEYTEIEIVKSFSYCLHTQH